MNKDNLRPYRRTARLTISIHIFISAVDTDGDIFCEEAHTQEVNEHGGKIATTHHLALGTEVLVENRALGVVAKARVVRLGKKDDAGSLHLVALELLEAKNVWGITFPPDNWRQRSEEGTPPAPTRS